LSVDGSEDVARDEGEREALRRYREDRANAQ
jgi:hypothetical protein